MMRFHETGKCLVAGLLLLCAVQAGSALQVTIGDATIPSVGGTVDIPLVLDGVPDGLSGCRILYNLSDPAVAEITGVRLPDWASPKGNTTLPGNEVEITLGDFTKNVGPGDTNIDLGALAIRGDQAGITQVRGYILHVDDEKGYPLAPPVKAGSVSIGSSTSVPPAGGVTPPETTMVPTSPTPAETPVTPTAGETTGQGTSGTATPVTTRPVVTTPVTRVTPSPSPSPSAVTGQVTTREEAGETRVAGQVKTTPATPAPVVTEAPRVFSPWSVVEQIIGFLKNLIGRG